MRRWLWIALVTAAVPGFAADDTGRVAASRAAVKDFMGTLQGELQAAMKAGGPTNAIEVCNKKAPAIAQEVSKAKGLPHRAHELEDPQPGQRA